jgi:FdhD protein
MKESLKCFQVERINEKGRGEEETFVIAESPITLFLNDQEVVTLLATPVNLKELAVGFLLSEGWLQQAKPIKKIEVDPAGVVRVWVNYRNPLTKKLFLRRTITSGCGRGTIFYNVLDSLGAKKIRSSAKISQAQVSQLMQKLSRRSVLYPKSGSVHGAALATKGRILVFCEDIGRHNAVDKIFGTAFLQGISPSGKILLTSGRISSEILVKAIKRQVPFLFSYSGPTALAVDMAREMGVTLIGYVRGKGMRIYSHGERVVGR